MANRIGLTSGYLNDVENYIKQSDVVVDPNYEEYLVRTKSIRFELPCYERYDLNNRTNPIRFVKFTKSGLSMLQ